MIQASGTEFVERGLDRSPRAQIAREALGGDAMEAPHPLLQPANGVPVSGLNVFRQLVQRYRGLPPALPGANVIPTAVRTAKARNPTPPDLRHQVFLRRGIVHLRDRERERNSSLIRQHGRIDRVSRRSIGASAVASAKFPERLGALRRVQKPNSAKPNAALSISPSPRSRPNSPHLSTDFRLAGV